MGGGAGVGGGIPSYYYSFGCFVVGVVVVVGL